jgi:hypothetical protein
MIENNNYSNSYSNFFLTTDGVTLILLLIALGIFLWLAIKSKNVKNFQFQISIFIVIWLLGDLVDVLRNNQIVTFSAVQDIGLRIHLISMIFFTTMLLFRFYHSKKYGRRIIDDLEEEKQWCQRPYRGWITIS